MSARPIHADPVLSEAIAQVAAMRHDFAELNGELSESEREFVSEARTRPALAAPPLVAEIDAVLTIPGAKPINITLSVHGRFTPARKGGHEPGERAYEPDEPAGFVMHSIMVGETDIAGDLGQEGEDAVTAYVMENC